MSEKETACLRDITETDIMEYMQVEHPHNEKELWKMKHATRCSMKCRRKW